ncbi:hypothetical protein L9F63_014248, partial [Diploptera punctata]
SCFYHPLQPIFLLTKVFGLFPFKLSYNASVMLNSNRKELFLPTVWFFVALTAGCYSLIRFFSYEVEDVILKGVCTAYYCFLGLTALSSITAMWFNRKKVKDIFRNLFAVDQLLDKSTTLILYKQTRSSSVKRMSFVFLFITIITACTIYYYFGNFLDVMLAVCESTLITINSMFIFQYVTIVQGIQTRYYQLWKNLKTLHKESKGAVTSQMQGAYIYNPYIADTVKISILRQQHFHLSTVVSLQNFHLSTVVSLLNQVYGFTMLLEIMTALSNCVGSLYDGIETLNRGESPINSASIIVSGALLFVPVIWVVMSCHRAVLQNEEHITAIQELLISRSTNLSTQNELKELLLQIKLMEPQFSAGGFFTLNLQFLCTSFSSIFTYIIIMAQ